MQLYRIFSNVLLGAALACLAACGGADQNAAPPGGSEPGTTPGPTPGPITPDPVPDPTPGPMPEPPPQPEPQPNPPPPPPAPSAIADLQPGQWLELPNTKIRSVLPNPLPSGWPAAIVEAWNGGAVDTARSRLLMWGGGHHDYLGNEIYALDLPTMKMRRLVEGSPLHAQSDCKSALPDGTPTARHTYDGLTYLAHSDRFFSVNGSMSPCGYGDGATFTYDFTNNRWQMPLANAPWKGTFGTMAVYDAQTQQVYVKPADHDFFVYSPQANKYTKLNTEDQFVDYHLSATIDTKRRKFVMIGDGVQVIDLNTHRMTKMATTNTPAFVNTKQSPGIDYDPVADRIVAWHGGRNVYALNMDTGAWTQVASNVGPSSAGKEQGTFGRWGYIPQYKVFALVTDIDENAWVFRLAK